MGLRGRDQKTEQACRELAARCEIISAILQRTGPPRWRARPGGYQGLARIIIEQQLSVASANAILARVPAALGGLEADRVLKAPEDALRDLGLSRPKIRYLKTLAGDVLDQRFCFDELARLSDDEAAAALCKLLGVGPWTAAVYLLFCEGRRDLWPNGDVALLAAHKEAGGAFDRSNIADFDQWAKEFYAPHRGVAAHILWGHIAWMRGRAPL